MIVDTDILSYFLRGDERIKKNFIRYESVLASTTINYAELLFGLAKKRNMRYLQAIHTIFENIKVYEFDKKSAEIFGNIKASMQKNGIVVADMDLMIASIAIANDEVLITNNIKHFSKIENLHYKSWLEDSIKKG